VNSVSTVFQSVGILGRSSDLLWSWTLRTVNARYQQSVLGWLWAVVQPAAQAAIFTLVFTLIVPVDVGAFPYVVFAYVAITPWAFLSTGLTDMTGAIVENLALVTKISFPREVLPLAALLARLLDFAIASLLVVALVLYYQIGVSPERLLLLPVLVCIQIALVAGLGLATAAANAFVRDVKPLLLLALQVWFYLSPIIYPITAVPSEFRVLYSLNPAVGIIEGYRFVWLGTQLHVASLMLAAGVSAVFLLLGYAFFKKAECLFADIA
jgi:lipopolysaccharide transport system permease protein